MSSEASAHARKRGLTIAAKIAGVGGIAVAAFGIAGAYANDAIAQQQRATGASGAGANDADDADRAAVARATSGAKVWTPVGGCGCSPCWGPPAPPAKSLAGSRVS